MPMPYSLNVRFTYLLTYLLHEHSHEQIVSRQSYSVCVLNVFSQFASFQFVKNRRVSCGAANNR